MLVFPNTVATCKGVAPSAEIGSLAIANFLRSKAACKSLILPSFAAKCTLFIFS